MVNEYATRVGLFHGIVSLVESWPTTGFLATDPWKRPSHTDPMHVGLDNEADHWLLHCAIKVVEVVAARIFLDLSRKEHADA